MFTWLILFIGRIHEFGHSSGPAGFVDAGQDAGAFREDDAGFSAFQGVGMLDAGGGDAAAGGG